MPRLVRIGLVLLVGAALGACAGNSRNYSTTSSSAGATAAPPLSSYQPAAYPGGPNSVNVLRVPSGRPVRLLMTSRDVIHSFYVPEFRVKQDVLPGRYSQIWFNATDPGRSAAGAPPRGRPASSIGPYSA